MEIRNKPYHLVVGLGISGLSMAKYLNARGLSVVATDTDTLKTGLAKELNPAGIRTEIGYHNPETFLHAHTIVPSPGIPLTHPLIRAALDKGVAVTGELDLFSAENTLPVIAVTGTNGKTTTTTLIGDILRACGRRPFVGGNIGTPLVESLMQPGNTDVIVAEISSFQMDLSFSFKPVVGVLLNISEDHLDRYSAYTDYETAKWRLFQSQSHTDTAVINRSIKGFEDRCRHLKSRVLDFSSDPDFHSGCRAAAGKTKIRFTWETGLFSIQTSHLKGLRGAHNRENLSAAVLACLALGETRIPDIVRGIESFQSLPHRLEFVKTVQGIDFYNDSKGTNTDAAIRALESFSRNIVLILGGREKGTDFSLLIPHVEKHVSAIVSIGESRDHVLETFRNICPVIEAESMPEAVEKGFLSAAAGDVVLLSPACASFDMYQNYAHRGNVFKQAVQALQD